MKKNSQLTIVISFTAFLAVFGILFFALPRKEFSEMENRYLAAPPKLTLSSLTSGKFTASFETYVSDQFPFRTFWVGTQALTEYALLKTENNGVYSGKDGFLSERFTIGNGAIAADNIDAVNVFVSSVDTPVYFALIPGSGEILRGKLPSNAIDADQAAVIADIYAALNPDARAIDLYSVMAEHSDEYIYFRTDHHWTPLGAGYAAKKIAGALGMPIPADGSETLLADDFRGSAFNASAAWWVNPDEIRTRVTSASVEVTDYNSGAAVPASLYNPEFLSKPGKYQYFLGGNSPRLVLRTEFSGIKLLIVRDSFTDALAPQLTESAAEIHLIDLRYYKNSVAEYIKENGIDKVLILYSVRNFCEDGSAALLQFTSGGLRQ
ncbi:MAG: hypothetical protein LBD85_00695 [Oscillospiraceae bacterium]|jgi:hypothetical protein|nr:hypothetical protein [Oscillospiraceae bacterium]